MKIITDTDNKIMIAPTSVEDAGVMGWLAKRLDGKTVAVEFDTTELNGNPQHPMMWLLIRTQVMTVEEAKETYPEMRDRIQNRTRCNICDEADSDVHIDDDFGNAHTRCIKAYQCRKKF